MPSHRHLSILVLALLLALTRGSHFGTLSHLPDASFAVFLLAGAFGRDARAFAALLFEAVALDALALSRGIGLACVTPAYVALIPAYALLFGAGRWARRDDSARDAAASAIRFAGTTSFASLAAFVLSTGSYWYAAVRPRGVALSDYAESVAPSFARYLAIALVYVGVLVPLFELASAREASRKTDDA